MKCDLVSNILQGQEFTSILRRHKWSKRDSELKVEGDTVPNGPHAVFKGVVESTIAQGTQGHGDRVNTLQVMASQRLKGPSYHSFFLAEKAWRRK